MVDLVIVLLFVAYALSVGFINRRQASRSLGEYFLAGRRLKGWQAGTSMAATQFAADTPLLVAGLVATGGIFLLWRLWIYGVAFLLMAFVFAALWRRSGVITDAEMTEIRYSGRGVLALRAIKAVYYGTVLNCFVLAMVLIAAIGLAEAFLPWHLWLPEWLYAPLLEFVGAAGLEITSARPPFAAAVATTNNLLSIVVIVAFTTLYSLTGGLRGVVATDLVQLLLGLIGTLVFAFVIAREAGGLATLGARIIDLYGPADGGRMLSFAPGWEALLLPFLTLVALQWVFQFASDGTGYLAQRSMACTDDQQARIAGVTFAWVQILLRSLPWLVIAVGLLVIYPFTPEQAEAPGFAARRELAFVDGIDDFMPPGARGLLLVGMLAALASTLDTHLNWGASYWSNDLYGRVLCQGLLRRTPGQAELVTIARLSYFAILAIAAAIMVNLDSIQEAWQLSLLFGAGVGSVLVLRWVWERINVWSEFAAMAVSLAVAPLVMWGLPELEARGWLGDEPAMTREALGLLSMAVCSTAAAVGVVWLTPRTDPAVLDAFFARVRPVGAWRDSARRAGVDPNVLERAFARALVSTGVTALSLFLCLYGTARLLLRYPDTGALWPVLALLGGLALVPVWWRRLHVAAV